MIEYDNIIKDKEELLNQLESLKEEAIYMLKNPNHDDTGQTHTNKHCPASHTAS